MARTGNKAQKDGWQLQAERLACTHTALATAAIVASEQSRHRLSSKPVSCHFRGSPVDSKRKLETSVIEPGKEPEPPCTKVEQARLLARATDVAWTLNARGETLAARALRASAVAEKRIAELENELGAVRKNLIARENEILGLQKSLDSAAGENSRLSDRLAENSTALDKARSELDQMKLKLTTVEAERDEANKNGQTEICALTKRLEAMSIGAVAAEKLLAQARQNFLTCATDKIAIEASLHAKERQIEELELARSRLVDDTNRLLKTCKARDMALFRAEEKIGLLAELFVQLEAKGKRSKSQKKTEECSSQLQGERMPRANVRKPVRAERTGPKRQQDNDDWLFAGTGTFLDAA
jgi:chromosome segregation ATPase